MIKLEKGNKIAGLSGMTEREAGRRQANVHAIQKLDSYTRLYLVGFDKNLTTKQAEFELSRIGFHPASLLESVLFAQNYQERLHKYLPVISLNAYIDEDNKIGVIKDNLYCLCLYREDIPFFASPGEIEFNEYSGSTFMKGTLFLVKPI